MVDKKEKMHSGLGWSLCAFNISGHDVFREAVKPAYEKLGWTELREQLYKEAGVEA